MVKQTMSLPHRGDDNYFYLLLSATVMLAIAVVLILIQQYYVGYQSGDPLVELYKNGVYIDPNVLNVGAGSAIVAALVLGSCAWLVKRSRY